MKQDTSMLRARESAAAPTSMLQGAPLRYCITKLRSAGQNLYFLRGILIGRRERRFTVAEWRYRIERIDLNPETDTDDQLGKILREYAGAGHAFENPKNKSGYRPEAAANAWCRTLSFFAQTIKAESRRSIVADVREDSHCG